ncbi:MAG: T9SS type A sorting domain-containing protein [Cytophagaceae bacterium]|jgi:hypothetical protein|nr:T9SS type A sorting domain-containing protein [Cytophagaceae bacterium]
MKKILFIASVFVITPLLCFCQIYKNEVPVSFLYDLEIEIEEYNIHETLSIVQDEPRIEIIENDTVEISDPVIGQLFDVCVNINDIGRWTEVNNGDSIWQVQINSYSGSYTMLIFDDFYLPQGTKLFVYSADRSQVLGAFTEENNVPSNRFSTAPLRTNSVVIEYYKPYYVKEQARLNMPLIGLIESSLTHDLQKAFGDSGNCMINAMCPEYDKWCNQRRSVALIFRVFTSQRKVRLCTGSLLVNERMDGKPFFLTAFHCLDGDDNKSLNQSEKNDVQNWAFVFNYQSPTCSNPATELSLAHFISGANYIKAHDKSDYALLQLNQKPPPNYNVFYNGWSNDKRHMTNTGVTIHHPNGDIKKISEWDKVIDLRINFWKVKWTKGCTEAGSSGAPLFNSSGYVVGQNWASNNKPVCDNKKRNFFGCFHRSWHNFGLSGVLNPNGTHSGSHQNWIGAMGGNETTKENWYFNNCNDLHTSDNVTYLNYSTLETRQYDGVYNAKNQITAENTTIQSGTSVVFRARNSIVLKPGFQAVQGSNFRAETGGDYQMGCNNGVKSEQLSNDDVHNMLIYTLNLSEDTNIASEEKLQDFAVYPNPNNGTFFISLPNGDSEFIEITVTDIKSTVVYSANTFTEHIQLPHPVSGVYIVTLHFKDKILTSKFTVL